ncbi:protein arginine kinase activator [Salirhabdus euzebyi]|uniref:Protein arginine kinase activator n=1 Tax=Salirhabdus euzebyi TaxID=394506 RepID=A0A841QAG1_9BACI|nr:UvrB/UvrC motif-containing protein [Salirhabdus euzebyi]MBB6455217.1 protein arginine kinase activator [Salirhabdus euzebyi]
MECQECEKRSATLHFTQVINGHKTEVHLCEYCAQEKGYMNNGEHNFSLHSLLSGLFNFDSAPSLSGSQSTSYNPKNSLQCEKCEMTYHEFTKTGKFGCANCYTTFNEHLHPIFRRVHSGNTKHDGKIPKRAGDAIHLRKTINEHKVKLKELIQNEEFEEAAKARDQIRELEKKLRNDRDGDS